MTPELPSLPLRLVIWDCDGVLVDSEPVACKVVAEEVTRLGWPMTPAESMATFTGLNIADMAPMIEQRTGGVLPPGWAGLLSQRLVAAMEAGVEAMPGAAEALRATAAMGLPYRVASNSSHGEMRAKFDRSGLAELVEGRIHSAADVGRGKPAPDLFLAAAAAQGMPPAACVVVEDSLPGVRAAVAAGMACIGYDHHGDGAALRDAGAGQVVRALSALPPLFRTAMRRAA